MEMVDMVREAIRNSGKSIYQLEKMTGVAASSLWRFLRNKRGSEVLLESIDRISAILGLRLVGNVEHMPRDKRMGGVWLIRKKLKNPDPNQRWIQIIISQKDGVFSAVAMNLPEVAGIGDTEKEAIRNVRKAIRSTLALYKAMNQPVPWQEVDGSLKANRFRKQKWIRE
jgi:predicted RNase H-like HicB family nuclease